MNNMLKKITKIMRQEPVAAEEKLLIDIFATAVSKETDAKKSVSPSNGELIFIDIHRYSMHSRFQVTI